MLHLVLKGICNLTGFPFVWGEALALEDPHDLHFLVYLGGCFFRISPAGHVGATSLCLLMVRWKGANVIFIDLFKHSPSGALCSPVGCLLCARTVPLRGVWGFIGLDLHQEYHVMLQSIFQMCDLDSSGCNPQWRDLCCCCWWGNTTQCCQVSLSISLLFLLSGELNCRAHGWCGDSVQWVWPLTSAWASGEMRVCVLHKLCIYELLNWFPLLQIKALVFALYWRQGKPSRKQTALLVLERTKSPIARN